MVGKMVKVLKQDVYLRLLGIIYKYSMFDEARGELLIRYITFKLLDFNFAPIIYEKLQMDTGILMQDKALTKSYDLVIKQMDRKFTQLELLEIKTMVFDILQTGYHL